ncbi:hypothetical protein [Kitasatospora camelliae]|uniref:Uncharacterized protein n=1 Tax=Kitasatospora camelliae TaxID=3156397 RepID=A0AAU8JZS0_9ACTN
MSDDRTTPEPDRPEQTQATPEQGTPQRADLTKAPTVDAPAPASPAVPQQPPVVEQPPVPAAAPDPWALPDAALPGQLPPGDALPAGLPPAEPKPPRDRKKLIRLGAAAAVLVLTGTATAVAVTLPERTDLPGLQTPNDGRYTFPALALPPLPQGSAAPTDSKSRHHADLRGLLLPAPREARPEPTATATATPAQPSATASPSASATATESAGASPSATPTLPPVPGRWVPCDGTGALGKDAAAITLKLTVNACRAAAAQGWTAKDGTRTEIRLLRFGSYAEANDVYGTLSQADGTKDLASAAVDLRNEYPVGTGNLMVRSAPTVGKDGDPAGRVGYLLAGDLVAVIQLANPAGVPIQPFRQVVALQSSMLDG